MHDRGGGLAFKTPPKKCSDYRGKVTEQTIAAIATTTLKFARSEQSSRRKDGAESNLQ
jgi:hypothetical protein